MYIPQHLFAHPNLDDIVELYNANIDAIATHHRERGVIMTYNFELNDELVTPQQMFEGVYQRQTMCFKIDASVGSIIQDNATGELRYFHSSMTNSPIFDRPILITGPRDFTRFIDKVNNAEYTDTALQQRPST